MKRIKNTVICDFSVVQSVFGDCNQLLLCGVASGWSWGWAGLRGASRARAGGGAGAWSTWVGSGQAGWQLPKPSMCPGEKQCWELCCSLCPRYWVKRARRETCSRWLLPSGKTCWRLRQCFSDRSFFLSAAPGLTQEIKRAFVCLLYLCTLPWLCGFSKWYLYFKQCEIAAGSLKDVLYRILQRVVLCK